MAIYAIRAFAPEVSADAFVAESADLIGCIRLGAGASVWFGAVLRADSEEICVGARTNIQDGVVCHADPGYPLVIEEDVTVGHRAILHGARIGRGALIGMGAVVLNGAKVGEESLLGAGSVLPEGKEVPPGMLAIGTPARVVRPLGEEERQKLRASAGHYVELGGEYRARLTRVAIG